MRLEENNSKPEARQPGSFTTQGGWVHADRAQECDILAKQFKSIFIKDRGEPNRECIIQGPAYPTIPDLIFREE